MPFNENCCISFKMYHKQWLHQTVKFNITDTFTVVIKQFLFSIINKVYDYLNLSHNCSAVQNEIK